ncbi:MAG: UDP-N-acetylmuramoyl-L-alanine--D-glutamate ligase [Patescibacteria group bacterium]
MPQKKFPDFKNKKVLIFGLGLLGRGVKDAIFFAEKGAQVIVTDLKTAEQLKNSVDQLKKYSNVEFSLGGHKNEDILWADLIIRNAGVPKNSPFIKLAIKNKISVDMDESLFAEYCPCPIIGITGTRGKSTTTVIIHKILHDYFTNKGKQIFLAGNLLGEATLPLIDQVTADDLVVLELSSWQLQGFGAKKISPHIAVFTNIFPDHLNYYKTMREYINDKKFIFQFQSKKDFCIINIDNNYTKKIIPEIPSNVVTFSGKSIPQDWPIKLRGQHNLENISSAIAVAQILKIPDEQTKKSVCEFNGLEHRLEFVDKINDIEFINDTTSTTPIAGIIALDSIKKPIILIAGGATKNLNLSPFAKTIAKKTKAVLLLNGTATDELEKKITKNKGKHLIVGRFDNFAEAVKRAYDLSLPGDVVLLSPGCASFGMFINEFDRGNQFKKLVRELKP